MLSRDEVRAAIRFAHPPRPPQAFTKWWGEGLAEQYGSQLAQFDSYEEDVVVVPFPCPAIEPRADGFYWRLPRIENRRKVGRDADALLPDWADLPALLADLPDTQAPGLFDEAARLARAAHAQGRYVLIHHWSLMYERIWSFRGMQNLLLITTILPKRCMRCTARWRKRKTGFCCAPSGRCSPMDT